MMYRFWDNNPSGIGFSVLNLGDTVFKSEIINKDSNLKKINILFGLKI